jgi:hypothetical protein
MESRVIGIIRRDIMPRMCLILMVITSSACTISPCGCLLSRLLQVLWEQLSLLVLRGGEESRVGDCERSIISNGLFFWICMTLHRKMQANGELNGGDDFSQNIQNRFYTVNSIQDKHNLNRSQGEETRHNA